MAFALAVANAMRFRPICMSAKTGNSNALARAVSILATADRPFARLARIASAAAHALVGAKSRPMKWPNLRRAGVASATRGNAMPEA